MSKEASAIVMDCAESRRWVECRLDGDEIPGKARGKLERHLVSCEGCRMWAAQMETALVRLQTLKEPGPSMQFKARLMRVLGLSPLPLWLRWAAGVVAGLSAAWLLAISFLGDRFLSSVREGLPLLPRILRLGEHLITAKSGLAPYLSGIIEIVVIIFGAAVVLVALGIVASRMVNRTRPATIRSA